MIIAKRTAGVDILLKSMGEEDDPAQYFFNKKSKEKFAGGKKRKQFLVLRKTNCSLQGIKRVLMFRIF